MVEVIPAIIAKDYEELKNEIALVRGLVPVAQIDISDGIFAKNITWPFEAEASQAVVLDEHFRRIINEEEGMPFWEDFDFEIDLMVSEPEKAAEEWIVAGAKRLIFHIESVSDFAVFIKEVRKRYPKDSNGDSVTAEIGAAIGITTPNEALYPILDELDSVQFMGIEKIGYQGQPFDERVIPKIRGLRGDRPDYIISVDGGVGFDTAARLAEAGANRLAVGSVLLKSENIAETVRDLQKSLSKFN